MVGVLREFKEDVFHLAPIPIYYKILDVADRAGFHDELAKTAREYFAETVVEVPDERHAETLGHVPEFPKHSWREPHPAAVGIWHCVPTNNFLDLRVPCVQLLRERIERAYLHTLKQIDDYDGRSQKITESWIQFYKNGDQKVLHNHERYDEPFYDKMWAGAYYLSDGNPRSDMKYSGILSFKIRDENYCFRPKTGLLLMWPADLLHEVHPFYGDSERIVLNWNINTVPRSRLDKATNLVAKLFR